MGAYRRGIEFCGQHSLESEIHECEAVAIRGQEEGGWVAVPFAAHANVLQVPPRRHRCHLDVHYTMITTLWELVCKLSELLHTDISNRAISHEATAYALHPNRFGCQLIRRLE